MYVFFEQIHSSRGFQSKRVRAAVINDAAAGYAGAEKRRATRRRARPLAAIRHGLLTLNGVPGQKGCARARINRTESTPRPLAVSLANDPRAHR